MADSESNLIRERWPELYDLVVSSAALQATFKDLSEEKKAQAAAILRAESERLGYNPLRIATLANYIDTAYDKRTGAWIGEKGEQELGLYILTHLMSGQQRRRAVAAMRDREDRLPTSQQTDVVVRAMELTAELDRRMDAAEELALAGDKAPDVDALTGLLKEVLEARRLAGAASVQIPFADMTHDFSGRIRLLGRNLDIALEQHGHRDYAPELWGDAKGRIMRGIQILRDGGTLDFWYLMSDLSDYVERGARHEVSARDLRDVREAMVGIQPILDRHLKSTEQQSAALDARAREIQDQLRRVTNAYGAGPAHIEALEMQYLALRVNERLHLRDRGNELAALQDMTLIALRAASTYCWSTMPVEAVASSAQSLRPEMTLGPETLGALAAPGTSGFWWFQKPVPVQTTQVSGTEVPVVALLWRRVIEAEGKQRVWFSTMIMMDADDGHGRVRPVPVPTTSWYFEDGLRLGELDVAFRNAYEQVYSAAEGRKAAYHAGIDQTVTAAVWFSRFFLAASAWLRQRIVVAERGEGTRQMGRQLQREHRLAEAPQVRVVHLRRRETATVQSVTDDTAQPGATRKLTCRFVVPGFWRNQWYPSSGQHKVIYIEDFVKGPADAPFKTKAKVYAVVR